MLRATAEAGPYAVISPLLVAGTTYRDVGLDATPYFYKVVAIDGTGNTGPISNAASATAQAGTDLPLSGTIAYEDGDNLVVNSLPALGAAWTLGQGRDPQFSRDGGRLFYVLNGTGIQVRPVAGGAPSDFYPDANIADFALAADEQHLGVNIFRQFASAGPLAFCSVTEPHYGTPGNFSYTDDNDLATSVGVSASGQWLTFRYLGFCNTISVGNVSPADFCIVNTANNAKHCLKGANYRDAVFVPTGNTLVFVANMTGQDEVWKAEVQPDGNLANYTQLTRGPAGQPPSAPSWSADGSWIVFQRAATAAERAPTTLFAVRADGAAVRSLGVSGRNPAWFGGGSGPGVAELANKTYLPVLNGK